MRTRLLIISLLLMLSPTACEDELTAADCEVITSEDACEKKGCTFVQINKAILDGSVCVASERRPGCILTGESWNNAEGVLCRDLPGGGYEFVSFSTGRPADGWEVCGYNIYGACDGPVATCEELTTEAACEAAHCYWAEPVRVGVIDGEGACTGWEPQTIGLCLHPYPYMTYFEGENDFDRYAQQERYFWLEPEQGPRRVLAFTVASYAYFSSGPSDAPDFWRECDSASDAPCSCP